MATDTQKLNDPITTLEAPKKTLESSSAPPTTTITDRPDNPSTDTPSNPPPSSEVNSKENGSKVDSDDPKTDSATGYAVVLATSIKKKIRRAKRFRISRKARAERFRLHGPAVVGDEDAKKKARLARFAPNAKLDAKTDPHEEEKRKARSLRFSNTSEGFQTPHK
ncbi:hypothetical protein ACFX19_023146 [Malus domestica]